MQEQLAEMQQKIVQLCSRIEQEADSECQEIDDTTSDSIDNDGNHGGISPALSLTNSTHNKSVQRAISTSPPLYSPNPKRHASGKPSTASTTSLETQSMSEITVKIHSPKVEHQQKKSPLLQTESKDPEDQDTHATNASISNAAAMYLGQHFLLEQEVRIAKEAAVQHERQKRQLQREQQKLHENQRRFEQEQMEAHLKLKEQQRRLIQQRETQNIESPQYGQQPVDVRHLESQAAAALVENYLMASQSHQRIQQPQPTQWNSTTQSSIKSEISEKFNMIRSQSSSAARMTGSELEVLADVLKSEITTSLSTLVDSIVTRFFHQRRLFNKQSQSVAAAADQLNKDLLMASQILDRNSPRATEADKLPSNSIPIVSASLVNTSVSNLISSQSAAMFQAPKSHHSISSVAAVSLYNSIGLGGSGRERHTNPFGVAEPREQNMEQNEALSLVVTPKKKRHKVTDTRITPRTVSRLLAQDGVVCPNVGDNLTSNQIQSPSSQQNIFMNQTSVSNRNKSVTLTGMTRSKSSSPRLNPYHPSAPPMIPVSLPTTVAIPNPLLHESQVFSPYSPFYNSHHRPAAAAQMHHMKMSSSPPGHSGILENRDSLAAAHQRSSPDFSAHLHTAIDNQDNSDCNSVDMQFDGMQPTISFLKQQMMKSESSTSLHSSTLTPMHLRKAKLMFFWMRYPSSAVLKMYFPDIKFHKNNTAQLVKWFSNFREFYYIQMEKYARQAVTDGVKNGEDLHVGADSELYRVLNLHYNRNNHIEVPTNFRFVVEQTLREFFRAIQGGKDTEQSWKKSIYKIISRMDDPVPDYFKSPNFLEQLE